MSSRERWIIYPLLFFAFCMAARDQLAYLRPRVVEISRLSCRVIEADWIGGKKMVAGELRSGAIRGERLEADAMQLGELDAGFVQCEQFAVASPGGERVAEMRATGQHAGCLTLFGPNEQPAVVLTHGDHAGLVQSLNADGSRLVLQAVPGDGALVVLDADGRVLGQLDVVPVGDAAISDSTENGVEGDAGGTSRHKPDGAENTATERDASESQRATE